MKAGNNASPPNHYLTDMFDYELPRQFAAWNALNSGEFPWWNPYTHGGIPFAAEAHFSITDPIRFTLYHFFPFESAFNWTLILHSFFSGLTMWLLLRHLAYSPLATLFGALSYQFAASHALFIFPQAILASFLFYPLLWIAWHSYVRDPAMGSLLGGGAAMAAILLAGEQQSDAYLPIFAACFCLGYGGKVRADWLRSIQAASSSFLIGSALALPVLWPQIEIYLLSNRQLLYGYSPRICLSGILSLSGVFPWALGTFRSLDVGKLVGTSGLGFAVYVGSAGAVLALGGIRSGFVAKRPELRTAACLLVAYFGVICSTPLLSFLYTRSSDLGVFGLILFLAKGVDELRETPSRMRRLCNLAMMFLLGLVVVMHIFALMLYPRIKPKVLDYVIKSDQHNTGLEPIPGIRSFQVENLPRDITVQNPEIVLAIASVVILFWLGRPGLKHYRPLWGLLLVSNLLPGVLYARRFIPCEPLSEWKALLAGGPEQSKIKNAAGAHLRLLQNVPGRFDAAFPGVSALYYGVHMLNGYATFEFAGSGQIPWRKTPNLVYQTAVRGSTSGLLATNTLDNVRYVWSDSGMKREVSIVRESFNRITLKIGAGSAGELVRTDTYYPGWQCLSPPRVQISRNRDGLLTLMLPAAREDIFVVLEYAPSYSRQSKVLSECAIGIWAVLAGGTFVRSWRRRKRALAKFSIRS